MTTQDPIVIVGAARTPMGGFQGDLAGASASELGAAAIRAALERARVPAERIDEIVFGCVLPAGQGQAPARQAALKAGLPLAAGATTVNKMCGSGMKAAMFAHDLLLAGSADVAVAGGMESMTNAPYLLPKARAGMRMGHGQVLCQGLDTRLFLGGHRNSQPLQDGGHLSEQWRLPERALPSHLQVQPAGTAPSQARQSRIGPQRCRFTHHYAGPAGTRLQVVQHGHGRRNRR